MNEISKNCFSPKYEFGVIVSFEFESFIVRVNISPVKPKEKVRTINFNFHTGIRKVEEAKERLGLYERALQKAERIFKNE